MFNIGFKEMATYSLAGLIGIAVPAIGLATLIGGYQIPILGATLFACGSGFVFAGLIGLNVIKGQKEKISALETAASVWIPKRGEKGRFVKASRDATYVPTSSPQQESDAAMDSYLRDVGEMRVAKPTSSPLERQQTIGGY